MRLCFLLTQKALHGCSTDGASTLHGVSSIFHCHLFRILHFRLLFALHTICLCHLSFLSISPFQTQIIVAFLAYTRVGTMHCAPAHFCTRIVVLQVIHVM